MTFLLGKSFANPGLLPCFSLRARAVRLFSLAIVVCIVATALSVSAASAASLVRGFADDAWFTGNGPGWVAKTVTTGAKRVLIEVDWTTIEPNAPSGGSDPTNPASANYSWSELDGRVKEFAGSGLSVVFLVTDAPAWAESPGGPAALEADGAWKPNATAYGQMAEALARRYSGSYPDPSAPGQSLPRVSLFQAWAEPNLAVHLAPQWTSSHGHLVATGPAIYRGMLNAFYTGVKRVHPSNTVITSGFGPYGDPASTSVTARTAPAAFVRGLLCVQGRSLKPLPCSGPAHFDALAIDPYEVGSPTAPALNADDVSAPDLGKLTRIVNRAVRLKRALPRGHKQLWVTEFSYDSNPPNPTAPSTATQAKWLEESFYVFWREGVNDVFWYLVRDQPGNDYNTSYFSGVYFYNGNPKPSFEAYRFPFVVMPSGRTATAWGISPRAGRLSVQIKHGHSWRTLFHTGVGSGSVFTHRLSSRLHGSFRALVGPETSLTWHR